MHIGKTNILFYIMLFVHKAIGTVTKHRACRNEVGILYRLTFIVSSSSSHVMYARATHTPPRSSTAAAAAVVATAAATAAAWLAAPGSVRCVRCDKGPRRSRHAALNAAAINLIFKRYAAAALVVFSRPS